GLITLWKNLTAARFSNSRDSARLPLLSNRMAMRTGVSDLLMSLIRFGCPSTRSSKSSSFRLLTASPRRSTTVAGTGTRLELTRTTSSESLLLLELTSLDPDAGEILGLVGPALRVVCRGRELLLGVGLGVGDFCRPDCELDVEGAIRSTERSTKGAAALRPLLQLAVRILAKLSPVCPWRPRIQKSFLLATGPTRRALT